MTPLITRITKIADFIESISEWSGRAVSWLVLAMVMIICYDASMRFIFLRGSVALQELEWHLFALVFLLGGAYTLKHDDHVRVDVLFNSKWMSTRRRAWVNLCGGLVLLGPFCLLVIISSGPFVASAYQFSETSPDPGGLYYRYLLKAAIPMGFSLLLLQGIAGVIRNAVQLLIKQEDMEK